MNPRTLLLSTGAIFMSCSRDAPPEVRFTANDLRTTVGGRPAAALNRTRSGDAPQILSVEILPGRGMNIYQVRAWLPGKGEVALLQAPPLDDAARIMNGGADDVNGNQSFTAGGAILAPYANRIRGRLLPGAQAIETEVLGKKVRLPANWKGRRPGAEPHAMHGLILASPFSTHTQASDDHARLAGSLDAGDFNGHWLSKTALDFSAELRADGFQFSVTARNTGLEPLPMGIGWHPYFVFPSGERKQARLRIPARLRAEVNNYDEVFPTGRLLPVEGTPYDFSAAGGAPLGDLFLDDCFVDLQRDGPVVAEIADPAAKYGLRVIGLSPEISAFQVYAPLEKNFVALEPQFNWGDPFGKIWKKGANTGMVVLQPGESVSYTVKLELFTP